MCGEIREAMACSIKYFGAAAVGENLVGKGLFTSWPPFGQTWREGDFNDTLIQPSIAWIM